jgi:hypothetical protein
VPVPFGIFDPHDRHSLEKKTAGIVNSESGSFLSVQITHTHILSPLSLSLSLGTVVPSSNGLPAARYQPQHVCTILNGTRSRGTVHSSRLSNFDERQRGMNRNQKSSHGTNKGGDFSGFLVLEENAALMITIRASFSPRSRIGGTPSYRP